MLTIAVKFDLSLIEQSKEVIMTNLRAYDVSDSNGSVVVANMTELEVKDAKIKALEDKVDELKAHIKSLHSKLDKAERRAYTGLGDQ